MRYAIKNENNPEYLEVFYFAYGSNLHKRQMKKRCRDSLPVTKAAAFGYELTFKGNRKDNGVADIQPKDGEWVTGAIYKVSKADRAALDRYEGYPSMYDRHVIDVVRHDTGKVVKAFVYRMLDHYRPTLPDDYYFNVIAEGYRDWDIDIDKLKSLRFRLELSVLERRWFESISENREGK